MDWDLNRVKTGRKDLTTIEEAIQATRGIMTYRTPQYDNTVETSVKSDAPN